KSIETAIKIVKNGHLRFFSPALFNDPFDGQRKLKCPYTDAEIMGRLVEIGYEKLTNGSFFLPIRPLLNYLNHEISKLHQAGGGATDLPALAHSALEFYYSYPLLHPEDDSHHLLTEINWIVPFQNNYRICSMSKKADNITMWSFYADQHQGVCLGFNKNLFHQQEKVNAHQVNYVNQLPTINDLDFWAHANTANYPFSIMEHMLNYLTSKSEHWSGEEEVRFACYDSGKSMDLTVDLEFDLTCLERVILGVRTPDRETARFASLLRGHLGKCELSKCTRSDTEFNLDMKSIDKRLA
ncbi:MAG: DUF2971 domain-containing protein, partial [Bdellovibrionales bacterium]|nr:DUF2971 domain-containing protein [Bdellovibrionales bacterium]